MGGPVGMELIIPNPKLKLLEQVKEVMRLRHYSIRTEQCYCDWIRRYLHGRFTRRRQRDEKSAGLFVSKAQDGTRCCVFSNP